MCLRLLLTLTVTLLLAARSDAQTSASVSIDCSAGTISSLDPSCGVANDGTRYSFDINTNMVEGYKSQKPIPVVSQMTWDHSDDCLKQTTRGASVASVELGKATFGICGKRNFVALQRANEFPASAMVYISGDNHRCSGAMVGKDLVLTAGHCVFRQPSTGNEESYPYSPFEKRAWTPINRLKVDVGYDNQTPATRCVAKRLYSVAGWTARGDRNFDIGAIKLDCDVAKNHGSLGIFWTTNSLVSVDAIVLSFPVARTGQQWTGGTVHRENAHQAFYDTDTCLGSSGAPVYVERSDPVIPAQCGPYCLHSVHSLNGITPITDCEPNGSGFNAGTRITQSLFKVIEKWNNDGIP